jgi:Transglutaminase-like superfamily
MLSVLPLPSNDFGTLFTLLQMRAMVLREFLNPLIRLTATDIVRGLANYQTEQPNAIREWVEDHTEFLRDPDNVEMLHGPVWQVQQIRQRGKVQVDCDDVAMLAAALGKSIGLRARFVVVGFGNKNAPYQHVWTELASRNVPLTWVDMDVTRPLQGMPFNRISRAFTQEV